MKRNLLLCLAVVLAAFSASPAFAAKDRLVIHEWGTFTSLQNSKGEVIAGVNTDDEPVPTFVHDIGNVVARSRSQMTPAFQANNTKGSIPRLHPDVTMRLETPVVYFHLPKGVDRMTLDLDVTFKGGWLSQYYPDAESNTTYADITTKHITPETLGALSWKGLEIGGVKPGPETAEQVWLAPRAVDAASVTTVKGESEKYLFYRGVGRLDASVFPMIARRDEAGNVALSGSGGAQTWLVDVREEGGIAFRRGGKPLKGAVDFKSFAEQDYSAANLSALQEDMEASLIKAGLFREEAQAMLKTWEYSYFRAPGQRVFYMVPAASIDAVLPMKVSVPADITRVMIGRIELMNASQQTALSDMKRDSADAVVGFIRKSTTDVKDWTLYLDVAAGKKPLAALGADVPPIYKSYLRLGRFRDAILLDENGRRPVPVLETFIRENQISMYQVK